MIKIIFPVLLLTFVNTIGFSILIPIMPFIIREAEVNDIVYGLIISCYSGSQFCGSMILGNLSDRYGRKPLLIISQTGTLLSWVIFGLAWIIGEYNGAIFWSLIIIAIARFTDGITGGNNTVANAYLSDILPEEKRSIAFGYVGAVLGLGIIIGPAIGAFTGSTSIGYLGMVIFSIALSTLTLLMIMFKLNESLPVVARIKEHALNNKSNEQQQKPKHIHLLKRIIDEMNIFKTLMYFKDRKIIISVFTSKLFASIALAANSTTILLLLIDRFQFNQIEIGLFLFVVGGFVVLNQIFLVKRFITWFGEPLTLLLGLILVSLGLFVFPILENLWLFITFYYFTNLGINLSFPTIRGIASRKANKQEQGKVMGIDESIFSLSMAIMPFLAAAIYSVIGWRAFMIWGFSTLVGAIIFFTQNRGLFKPTKQTTS